MNSFICLSLLVVCFAAIYVDCRRLTKLDKINQVLSDAEELLTNLKEKVSDEGCSDVNRNCQKIKEKSGDKWSKRCDHGQWIKDNCKKTCGICGSTEITTERPVTTEDRPSTTEEIITDGPSTTEETVTDGPSTTEEIATDGPSTTEEIVTDGPSTTDNCQDVAPKCQELKERIEGEGKDFFNGPCKRGDFFQTKCKQTCGLCGSPSTTRPSTTEDIITDGPSTTEEIFTDEPSTTDDNGPAKTQGPVVATDFEECTEQNKGHCECGDTSSGITTYVIQVNGETRCFTVYRPTSLATEKLPVVITSQCYGKDRLVSLGMVSERAAVNQAAARYGYARIGVSTPDGGWQFGNDGIVNDEKPMPCSENDSKDAVYVNKVFEFINSNPSVFNSEKIYAEGFSQNSMFSAYIGFCHSEQVTGIWQGGSGMALSSQADINLPGKQSKCTASLYSEHKSGCVDQANPCPGCKYWPIYPCYQAKKPMVNCIADYNNDYIANARPGSSDSTAENMYEAMVDEGHDARLLRFQPSEPSQTIPGGHKDPRNTVYWQVGCWGMTEKCSSECELSFIDCVGEQGPSTGAEKAAAFETCISEDIFSTLSGCEKSCSPTYDMLIRSEEPYKKELSKGIFGASKDGAHTRPNTSKCEAE